VNRAVAPRDRRWRRVAARPSEQLTALLGGPQRRRTVLLLAAVLSLSRPTTETFIHQLVTERLCACGHVTGPIRSIYRWAGDIHDETETRVALHTRRTLVAAIVAATQAVHPYQVPGIFVLPLIDGSPDYLQWVRDETTPTTLEPNGEPTNS
jgi:periplasmic divalent cation tolerance protein